MAKVKITDEMIPVIHDRLDLPGGTTLREIAAKLSNMFGSVGEHFVANTNHLDDRIRHKETIKRRKQYEHSKREEIKRYYDALLIWTEEQYGGFSYDSASHKVDGTIGGGKDGGKLVVISLSAAGPHFKRGDDYFVIKQPVQSVQK
jgi:hypothetical protein